MGWTWLRCSLINTHANISFFAGVRASRACHPLGPAISVTRRIVEQASPSWLLLDFNSANFLRSMCSTPFRKTTRKQRKSAFLSVIFSPVQSPNQIKVSTAKRKSVKPFFSYCDIYELFNISIKRFEIFWIVWFCQKFLLQVNNHELYF